MIKQSTTSLRLHSVLSSLAQRDEIFIFVHFGDRLAIKSFWHVFETTFQVDELASINKMRAASAAKLMSLLPSFTFKIVLITNKLHACTRVEKM